MRNRLESVVRKSGVVVVCLSLALASSGCGKRERREALGGGALEPVKVTLLLEEGGLADASSSDEGAAAAGPKIESFGTFKGRVTVSGGVPNLPPLVAKGQQVKDAICSKEAVPNQSALVSSDGGLANVFVFLRKVPNVDVPAPPTEAIVIDQKGCVFVPHASVIRVGQPLRLINSDPVAHNVKLSGFAMSFNMTIPGGDTVGVETTYQRAERGPIPVACDFHGWMQAFQLAVDHPWAALTQEDGSFVIENVPAGDLEFVVWHEKLGNIEKALKVTVPADGVVERTIEANGAGLAAQ